MNGMLWLLLNTRTSFYTWTTPGTTLVTEEMLMKRFMPVLALTNTKMLFFHKMQTLEDLWTKVFM